MSDSSDSSVSSKDSDSSVSSKDSDETSFDTAMMAAIAEKAQSAESALGPNPLLGDADDSSDSSSSHEFGQEEKASELSSHEVVPKQGARESIGDSIKGNKKEDAVEASAIEGNTVALESPASEKKSPAPSKPFWSKSNDSSSVSISTADDSENDSDTSSSSSGGKQDGKKDAKAPALPDIQPVSSSGHSSDAASEETPESKTKTASYKVMEAKFGEVRKPSSLSQIETSKKVSFDVVKDTDDKSDESDEDDESSSYETYYSSDEDDDEDDYDEFYGDEYDDDDFDDDDFDDDIIYEDDESYEYETDSEERAERARRADMEAAEKAALKFELNSEAAKASHRDSSGRGSYRDSSGRGSYRDSSRRGSYSSRGKGQKRRRSRTHGGRRQIHAGGPRKPFENIPTDIQARIHPIHPIDEEPMNNSSRKHRHGSSKDHELGIWYLNQGAIDEEVVFEKKGIVNRLFGGLVSKMRKTSFPKPKKLDETNPSEAWEAKDFNDDISQITDPFHKRGRRRSSSSKRSVRNTERALEDLELLSIPGLDQRLNQRSPKDPWIPAALANNRNRNNKRALIGLEPLSIRKYGLVSNGNVQEKVPLADMDPVSVPLHFDYKLDVETPSKSVNSKDNIGPGTIDSNPITQHWAERGLDHQFLKGEIIEEEVSYDEEIVEEEVIEEEAKVLDKSNLSIPDGSPDSYSTEELEGDKHSNSRLQLYCLVLLLTILLVGVGLWFLLTSLLGDEDPLPNPQSPIPNPMSPTSAPAPNSTPSGVPTSPLRGDLVEILSPLLTDGGQSLDDPSSSQSKALTWILGNDELWSYSREKIITRFALAVFYHDTDGDNWIENRGWLTDHDECTWFTADFIDPCNSGIFTNLVLGDNNIQGTLPADLVLLSDHLTRINLGGALSGSIPSEYGDLSRLQSFQLNGNTLSGQIPATFQKLTSLQNLELNKNNLTGTIDARLLEMLTDLRVLDLGSNELSGLIPRVFKFQRLTELSLGGNNLKGVIPAEIGGLTELEKINLDDNEFTHLPQTIGALTNLRELSIRNNEIGGTLHKEIGNLHKLEGLFLNNNAFTGSIPSEFGALTNLASGLDLSSNSLSGGLPSELGSLSSLSKSLCSLVATLVEIVRVADSCCVILSEMKQRIFF